MKEYNSLELKRVLDIVNEREIEFKIEATSIQMLKGIYLILDETTEIDGDYTNAILIEELKEIA